MSEWWTYTLSDLQAFSLQTYHRLFELYNAAIWPAPLVAIALGAAISWLLLGRRTPARGRVIAGILAAGWLWVAIAFHADRYATIHRAAAFFAWGFGLEALLLIWTGVVRGKLLFEPGGNAAGRAGASLFLFALLAHPLLGLAFGRNWRSIEIFGVAPDPTAVATLGLLLSAAGRARWELIAIPAIWCVVSGASLLAMESRETWIPLAAVALVLSFTIARSVARERSFLPTTGGPHGRTD